MFTLFGRAGSGSVVVECLLELAGAGYRMEDVPPGDGRSAPLAYRALNPLGQVPTLLLPDGAVMTESAAITIHLCDLFPGLGLAPAAGTPARGQFLRWLFFCAASLYASNMRLYYGERYTDDADGGQAVKTEAESRLAREWAVVAEGLGAKPFMLGGAMSALDIYVAMLIDWNSDVAAFRALHPNLAAMRDRVAAVPKIADVWQRNGLMPQ